MVTKVDSNLLVDSSITLAKLDNSILLSLLPTGTVIDYCGATTPTGYVFLAGKTIGSAASGATERANADTQNLYILIWNSFSNTEAPVSTGRGANGVADFAANKTITLPDARGRIIVAKDDMGGSAANRVTSGGSGIVGSTLGATGGAETHTLSSSQMPTHSHTQTTPPINNIGTGSQFQLNYGSAFALYTGESNQSGNAGSGTAHNNTQPSLILNKIIKL